MKAMKVMWLKYISGLRDIIHENDQLATLNSMGFLLCTTTLRFSAVGNDQIIINE